jgi:gliding motility-associated-like protein
MKFKTIFAGFLLGLCFAVSANEPQLPVVEISAISVNPWTNQPQILWTPSSSLDVYGYGIYEQLGNDIFSNSRIDSIFGRDSNNYTVKRHADTFFLYRIDAFDHEFNRSPVQSNPKRVFWSKSQQRRGCERKIDVRWNDARQSITDISHFEVWILRKDGDEPWPDMPDMPDTTVSASHRLITISVSGREQKIKIFVRAVSFDTTIFANSIADSFDLVTAPEPKFAYLETVSVIDDNTVEIRCSVDTSVPWRNLLAYADDVLVSVVSYDDFLKNNRIVLPKRSRIYHFEINDTCGELVKTSNFAEPILLEVTLQDSTVNLEFSKLIGSFESDIRYEVFQSIDGQTRVIPGLLPNLDLNLPHEFQIPDLGLILNLSYVVVAYEIGSTRELARSNVKDVISRTEYPVFFPTGFNPNSTNEKNRIFRPIYVPHENDRMQFRIFNTYGQVVFSTNDPSDGWNGTFLNTGNECQPGGYVFTFELTRNGRTMRKKGSITMIRGKPQQ